MEISCPEILNVGQSCVIDVSPKPDSLTCSDTGRLKGDKLYAVAPGECEIVAKSGDEVKKVRIIFQLGEIKKPGKMKDIIVDTSIFPILNPDIAIVVLLCLSCIICTAIVTTIFTSSVDMLKVIGSLISAVSTLILAVAKVVIPKGQVSKQIEAKVFTKKNFLTNTQEIVKSKLGR